MKRVCAVLAASCVLALALSGCGSSKATDAESLKGFWEIDSSTMGFDAALNLDEENFAELVMQDSYLEGTWSADGSNATITFEDAQPVPIYVSDGKLIYGSDNASKLVFNKSDIEEFASTDSSSLDDDDFTESGSAESTEEEMKIVDEVIEDITAVSIADDDICKIEVTGKGTDFTGDPGYRLSITNKYKKPIYIVANDLFSINDKQVEAGIGEVVEPGEKVDAFMYFSADEVGGADKLSKVEGKIVVGDDDESKDLKTYDFKME